MAWFPVGKVTSLLDAAQWTDAADATGTNGTQRFSRAVLVVP